MGQAEVVTRVEEREYEQGKGWLNPTANKYCCLGVLGAEMVPEFCSGVSDPYYEGTVAGEDTYLPDDLATLYGLDQDAQSKLSDLNDQDNDFITIADWIEANL